MPRKNPQVEQLEREVAMLRSDLRRIRTDPGDCPVVGCMDGSCLVEKPQGMHTNGGCRCDERKLRHALQWWKRRSQFLEETIKTMKSTPTETFEETWAKMEAKGYQYGSDALEQVRFGWELAKGMGDV